MPKIHKVGGIVAIINAVLAVASLIVAFGLIGAAALTDSSKLVQMAVENPTPLVLQDLLKFAAAFTGAILVAVLFKRLHNAAPRAINWATLFGAVSVLLLAVNASLSLYAVSRAKDFMQTVGAPGAQLNGVIGLLGMAVIAINGVWYLLVSWVALKSGNLPRWLSYLGLLMGGISLLPPLGVIVLLLSIPWSFGLASTLLSEQGKVYAPPRQAR